MRMKFNKSRQLLLVSAVSLLAAGLMTACGTATTDFVFVASAKAAGPNSYGEINVFEINRVSGAMRQIPSSPFPSGGRDPVAEAVSSDDSNLYVVNEDDNTIVQFMIGSDGKLYPQNTVNTPGIYPLGVAVSGSNLFVVDTYQPLSTCSNAQPCSGSVAVFPIEPASGTGSSEIASGKLGAPVANGGLTYWPLCQSGYISDTDYTHCKTGGTSASSDVITPTAINVMASSTVNYVFVTAYDSTVTPAAGYVFGFSAGSDGALMPLNGGVPVAAGIHPSAIASDSNSHIYVTDSKNGDVRAFTIASGALSELSGSPFAAGNQPSAIVVDPLYPFAYIANAQDGNISAYSIGSNGALASIGTFATGTQPVAIGIDPSTSHFLFTANFLGSNISDFELNSTTGTLINAQHSPYTSNALPTAVAAIPHGGTKK
jgi:6-phosphogluconolactonase (cycloisomerase 2 family)